MTEQEEINKICQDFFKQMEENDKLVAQDKRSYQEKINDFAQFIDKNKCKKKGQKND